MSSTLISPSPPVIVTSALIGRPGLTNNNNVKDRIAMFNKTTDYRPMETFAVGFWAKRAQSGSTLTLYEDIVSSESEDEETNNSLKPPNIGRASSYKNAISNGRLIANRNTLLPRMEEEVSKKDLCELWLDPHSPYNSPRTVRKTATSKYDARDQLKPKSPPSSRKSSDPKHLTQILIQSQSNAQQRSNVSTHCQQNASAGLQRHSSSHRSPALSRRSESSPSMRVPISQQGSWGTQVKDTISNNGVIGSAPDARGSQSTTKLTVNNSSLADHKPATRSSSAESQKAEQKTFKSEFHIRVDPFYHHNKPMPAPRRVQRAKSTVAATRPTSFQDRAAIFQQPLTAPICFGTDFRKRQQSETIADDSEMGETKFTDVNLFNINSDAISPPLTVQPSQAQTFAITSMRKPTEIPEKPSLNEQLSADNTVEEKNRKNLQLNTELEITTGKTVITSSSEEEVDSDGDPISPIYENIHVLTRNPSFHRRRKNPLLVQKQRPKTEPTTEQPKPTTASFLSKGKQVCTLSHLAMFAVSLDLCFWYSRSGKSVGQFRGMEC